MVFGEIRVCKNHDKKRYILGEIFLPQVETWELASPIHTQRVWTRSCAPSSFTIITGKVGFNALSVYQLLISAPRFARYIFPPVMRAIVFVFSLCVLVLAAPVNKGDIKLVRNKFLTPPIYPPLVCILAKFRWDHELMQRNMEQTRSLLRCQHPCVVVSDADNQGEVKVATVSHQHFPGVKTKPANDYAPFERNPGLGQSSISVDPPRMVHVSHLKDASREPKTVKPDKLQKLIKDISTYIFGLTLCEMYFSLADKNCSPDQQLTGVCRPMTPVARMHGSPERSRPVSSSKQHGSPVHGSPEHGRPVHGSPEHGHPVHSRPDHGAPGSSSGSGWRTVTRKGRRRGK